MIAARKRGAPILILLALMLLGLGLRLLVWRWHEFYGLGGDENEYFNQALTFLQGRGYVELPLMRPPLYTVFLAIVFRLFDSQVQRVRLVQALISTGTIALFCLWARELFFFDPRRTRIALIAAALAALCFTFAANATELLTETIFLFGLTLVLWLIFRAARLRSRRWALFGGVALGALSLVRSVALPLVPLAALWLLVQNQELRTKSRLLSSRSASLNSWFLVLGSLVVIAPWTIRNVVQYRTPIIIDTTGAENLWLDNNASAATSADPLGREAAKRELYALGNDRGARQRLATQRGIAEISANPGWFAAKAWGEAKKFVALEYWDDLRTRRAIWAPPLEVWLRLLLGDGVWLITLLGGSVGLWFARNLQFAPRSAFSDGRWLLVPWALYVFVTGLIFHVEIRYRLPVYPALLPFAAWTIAALPSVLRRSFVRQRSAVMFRTVGSIATVAALSALLLLHRPYIGEGAMLLQKHVALWQGQRALQRGDTLAARQRAATALARDPESALARVLLGRTFTGDEAQTWWREAIAVLPAHPYAHLLLGNALRAAGDEEAARSELAYETASLEDVQQWALRTFARKPEQRLDIGDGLDLGAITGFYPAQNGTRWTRGVATIQRLTPGRTIELRLRSPRPAAAAPANVQVLINGQPAGSFTLGNDWQTINVNVPPAANGDSPVVTLRTTTFRPRAFDRANPDNRALGVEVDWVQVGS